MKTVYRLSQLTELYFKWMDFIVRKLYHNKVDILKSSRDSIFSPIRLAEIPKLDNTWFVNLWENHFPLVLVGH